MTIRGDRQSRMDSKRRYSEEEVAQILDAATETQASGPQSLSSGAGMTLTELQDIGREVGISTDLIARAAAHLDQPGAVTSPQREFLGAPIGVGRTVNLSRPLTDAEWDRLVVDLRETFDARGRLHEEGSFRQWTNSNLQALLEPTDTGVRLRLKTVKGNAIPSLGMGLAMLGAAPVTWLFSQYLGMGSVELPILLGLTGLALYGINRIRLPNWAATRRLQMDGVAERLTAAVDSSDPAGSDSDS